MEQDDLPDNDGPLCVAHHVELCRRCPVLGECKLGGDSPIHRHSVMPFLLLYVACVVVLYLLAGWRGGGAK